METIEGKIKRKSVKATQYGDRVSFMVGATWISAFSNDKKLNDVSKGLLKDLKEGDEAIFTIVENEGKSGEKYLNITDILRIDRESGPPDYEGEEEVRPGGHQQQGGQRHKGDAPDSMLLSYAKDGAIALVKPGETAGSLVDNIRTIYLGLKAILAGEWQ